MTMTIISQIEDALDILIETPEDARTKETLKAGGPVLLLTYPGSDYWLEPLETTVDEQIDDIARLCWDADWPRGDFEYPVALIYDGMVEAIYNCNFRDQVL